MVTFLLTIHVLTAILGLGVVTAFPFLGLTAEKEPRYAAVLNRMTYLISNRVIYPAMGIQLITGVLLIIAIPLNLTKNAWLGASIILFLAVAGLATGVMSPAERKLIPILEAGDGTSIPDEARPLMSKLRAFGTVMNVLLVAIIILMVVRPGHS